MTSQTIATFTAADTRTVQTFRRKFPRAADGMLRLAVVKMARDGLYDSTAKVLAERVTVLENETAGYARYEALLTLQGCTTFHQLCDEFGEMSQKVVELEAELASVYEKTGADFEKVRFLEDEK